MEANKILTADLLDIVFEGRNKAYGAYDLRRGYRKRLLTALGVVGALFALLALGYLLANKFSGADHGKPIVAQDVQLTQIKPQPEETPPPMVKPKEPPKAAIVKLTPPRIIQDKDVKEDEKPPEVDKLDDAKIGNINQDGIKDDGIIAPPIDDGKGVVEAPKRDEADYDGIFTRVEIESTYPGGMAAWARYLNKTLRYPQDALDQQVQGSVVVQFIVDKEGAVTDVEAMSGPKELWAEAVRVIKQSGKWTPAQQNGRLVKSYKKQPVQFQIADQ